MALLHLLVGGQAHAQDKIRLRNGKEITGKIISTTPKVVTIQLDSGVLRVLRAQVEVIIKEQNRVNLATPPETTGKAAAKPEVKGKAKPVREPEPGEEGFKPQVAKEDKEGTPAKESKKTPTAKAPKVGKKPAPGFTRVKADKPLTADDLVVGFLNRYLFIVPKDKGNRISLGIGIFFILTMILHFTAKLADIENLSLARSLLFSLGLAGITFMQVTLLRGATWPILAGAGGMNILLWYSGVKMIHKEGFWRGSVMMAFFVLALLLAVLWMEVAHFLVEN